MKISGGRYSLNKNFSALLQNTFQAALPLWHAVYVPSAGGLSSSSVVLQGFVFKFLTREFFPPVTELVKWNIFQQRWTSPFCYPLFNQVKDKCKCLGFWQRCSRLIVFTKMERNKPEYPMQKVVELCLKIMTSGTVDCIFMPNLYTQASQ